MTYKEFKTRIEQEIRIILGEEREIKYQTVHKLNGISYEGLSISDGKAGSITNISIGNLLLGIFKRKYLHG